MWNCDWEYENQETLKQWYEEKISGAKPDLAVRKIICKGCGRVIYTQISTKKYCYYYLCGNRGYQKDLKQRRLEKRQNRICKPVLRLCGNKDTACQVVPNSVQT